MLYSVIVAVLLSASALCSERILAELRLPRRFVWLAALLLSLALPAYAVLTRAASDELGVESSPRLITRSPAVGPTTLADSPSATAIEIKKPLLAWPSWDELGAPFAVAWLGVSASICALFFLSWLSLRRKLSRAEKRVLEGVEVRVLDEYGPAVFGFFRPQIILPRWLFAASAPLQRIVLKHERAHIDARDQLTLFAALFLVAAAPWNLPLWWQLRRLRYALEIDCDARVLRDATPETAYAEALLEVQQRRTRMPISAIALIEPVTQLERRIRIMMSRKERRGWTAVAFGTPVAAALLVAACAVNAPDADAPLIKARPAGSMAAKTPPNPIKAVAGIVVERYGNEIRNNERQLAIVDLFFDESGALQRSTIERTERAREPISVMPSGPSYFFAICLDILEGKSRCEIESATNSALRPIRLSIFGTPSALAAADSNPSEDIDRRIAERYFANIFSTPPPENSGYWVLFDSGGAIVAAGREVLTIPLNQAAPVVQIVAALQQRYPLAKIERVAGSPIKDRESRAVLDRAGKSVTLYSGWLTADSSLSPR
jgi:beta-lactamase regulating signal transducer with metallopeptidase domain